MSNLTLLNQIVNQILNRTEVHVIYEREDRNGVIKPWADSFLYLIETDEGYFINNRNNDYIPLNEKQLNIFLGLFTDEQIFCTDAEIIRTRALTWDEFLNSFLVCN